MKKVVFILVAMMVFAFNAMADDDAPLLLAAAQSSQDCTDSISIEPEIDLVSIGIIDTLRDQPPVIKKIMWKFDGEYTSPIWITHMNIIDHQLNCIYNTITVYINITSLVSIILLGAILIILCRILKNKTNSKHQDSF